MGVFRALDLLKGLMKSGVISEILPVGWQLPRAARRADNHGKQKAIYVYLCIAYISVSIVLSNLLPMPPRGRLSYPRLFRVSFRIARVASDGLRRTSATAERNRLICEHFQRGKSLSDIARTFHISVQRVHQIVHGHRK